MPSPVCFLKREGQRKALSGIEPANFFPSSSSFAFPVSVIYGYGFRMIFLTRVPSLYFRYKKTPPAVRQTGPYL